MNEFVIDGRIDSALTHFAAVGLAGILDEDGVGDAVTWWADREGGRAVVGSDWDASLIASKVLDHARRHAESASWIQRRITSGPRRGSGLFTARVKAPMLAEWEGYADERATARPTAVVTPLDEQMQLALGEPAWWRCNEKETRPDDGASRWEMKTRNQGQEFLVHRLAPLAQTLARRTPESVLAGLDGSTVRDETGKDAAESRTSTGLTRPGPVDTAKAWCGMWGLHVAPTIQRVAGVGESSGVWPRNIVHPRWSALPVYSSPVAPRAFADVLASRRFDVACAWEGPGTLGTEEARKWLVEHGVRAIVKFPVLRAGSKSAPERQLLSGTLEPL